MDSQRNTLGLEFDDDPKELADMCKACTTKYPGADLFRVLPVENIGLLLDYAISKSDASDDNGNVMSPDGFIKHSNATSSESIAKYKQMLIDKKTNPEKMGMAIALFIQSFWESVVKDSRNNKVMIIDVTLQFLADVHVGLREHAGNNVKQKALILEKKDEFEEYINGTIDSDELKKVLSQTMPIAQVCVDISRESNNTGINDARAVKHGLEQLLQKVS